LVANGKPFQWPAFRLEKSGAGIFAGFACAAFCYGAARLAIKKGTRKRFACSRFSQGETDMLKEFQEFIAKGNVMDLAVGVIIGGAFGLIVNSLVGDIIMPIIGAIFGGFDFSNYFLPLSANVNAISLVEAKKQGAVFAYGNFLTVVINFLILAWIIFLMVKAVNTMRRRLEKEKPAEPAGPPPADVALLTEIRDLLARK
jgi:large conductance mechanosensitive channel